MFPLRLDFVNDWSAKTAIACRQIIQWIDIGTKFYHWKGRYGQVNEHNAKTPRDHWLEDWDIRLSVPDRQTQ